MVMDFHQFRHFIAMPGQVIEMNMDILFLLGIIRHDSREFSNLGKPIAVIHDLDFPFTRERRIAAGRDQNQPLSIWRKFVIPHRMTRRKFGINLFNERVVKTDTVQTIICHIGIAKTVGKVANRSFRIRGPGETLNPWRLTLDL